MEGWGLDGHADDALDTMGKWSFPSSLLPSPSFLFPPHLDPLTPLFPILPPSVPTGITARIRWPTPSRISGIPSPTTEWRRSDVRVQSHNRRIRQNAVHALPSLTPARDLAMRPICRSVGIGGGGRRITCGPCSALVACHPPTSPGPGDIPLGLPLDDTDHPR